jgi:UDP-N-acetylmuramoyl-L-alanyl-D-glutamate--2,6-diaminopimelate ligase
MSMPAQQMTNGMTLSDLLEGFAVAPAIPVRGISSDSRALSPGDVFLACRRATGHGIDYVEQAIEAGAAAVAWDSSTAAQAPNAAAVPVIAVPNLAKNLGEIANRFFACPSKDVSVFAVTGTNGKTTVAMLVAEALSVLGKPCGYIGTLGSGVGELLGSAMTTPDCVDLHRTLAAFRDEGARFAAVEVSSHALVQGRVNGLHVHSAAFTNLSRDHLDYHETMADYGAAKARLFDIDGITARIINVDSDFGRQLAERLGGKATWVSAQSDDVRAPDQFVRAPSIVPASTGSFIKVESSWGEAEFHLPLLGDFNVGNALVALAALLHWDVPLTDACRALGEVTAPAGRMQRVVVEAGAAVPAVIVDFAHTPAGLEAVLKTLRAHTGAALWCVFGCGGDRDRGKRGEMGRVAAALADRVVVTSDNPRSELPTAIIDDILSEIDRDDVVAIEDRAAAIAYAIAEAEENDIVLIAGKGHESFQLIGNRKLPFLDYDVARGNLLARVRSAAG